MLNKEDIVYRDVAEVETKGSFRKAVNFKPQKAPLICAVIGAGLLFINNLFARLMGVFFILMALAVLKLVRDYKVMDIFDQGVEIYGDEQGKTAFFLNYEDIVQWGIKRDKSQDAIEFDLGNGLKIVRTTFQASKAYDEFSGLMREKEDRYIEMMENREKIPGIPEVIENIRNRWKKK